MKNVLTTSVLAAVLATLTASARTQPADLEEKRDYWEGTWADFSAAVSEGGSLVLTNDVCQFGTELSVTTDFRLDLNGHTISGDDGQRLFEVKAGTLTVADGSSAGAGRIVGAGAASAKTAGAAVLVQNDARFVLEGGTLTGYSTPGNRGGAVSVSGGATFEMCGGAIANCSAGAGGAVSLMRKASFRMSGGAITNCSSVGAGGAIFCFTTDAVISGGFIAGCTSREGETISLTSDAALTISGGCFRRAPDASFVSGGGQLTVCGGASDFAWPALADGYEDACAGIWHWTARAGTCGVEKGGLLVRGDFLFDPLTVAEARSSCHPAAVTTKDTSSVPAVWRYRLTPGTTFTNTVEDIDLVFASKGDAAQVGDGANAAASTETEALIVIPETACGYPVDGIAAAAFSDCTNAWGFVFRGQPPAEVAENAFPTYWPGYYPIREQAAWEAVITTEHLVYTNDDQTVVTNDLKTWGGLTMDVNPYVYYWRDLVDLAERGRWAFLMKNVEQDGEELSVTNGTADVYAEGMAVTLMEGRRFARVGDGATLVLSGVSVFGSETPVAGDGGLVTVDAGGYFVFENGALIGGCATGDGGAVYVAAGGACEMGSASDKEMTVISDCQAVGGRGGAVAAAGAFDLISGIVTNNTAAGSGGGVCAIADTARVRVFGGRVLANVAGEPGAAVSCEAGETSVFGGVYLGYASAGTAVFACATDARFRLSGGVSDMAPSSKTPLLTEGFSTYAVGTMYTAALTDSVSFDRDGSLLRGRFTYDPSAEAYGGLVPLNESCEVVWDDSVTNAPYLAIVHKGGPYVAELRGLEYTYYLENGRAVLGGPGHPALADPVGEQVFVPGAINGFTVVEVAVGAFTNQTQAKEFVFMGPPPVCGVGALPSGARIAYSAVYEDEWKAVVIDGKWNGYTVIGGACYTWEMLKAVLEAGRSATLGIDLVQDGSGIVLANGADLTLTLSGRTITGRAGEPFVTIDDANTRLTIVDLDGTGRIVGSGDATGIVVDEGEFVLSGGIVSGYGNSAVRVGAQGRFVMHGGWLKGNSAERGGAVHVAGTCTIEGGTLSGNSAKANGAAVYVAAAGSLRMAAGTVSDNTCATSGAGVLAGEGVLTLAGGKIVGAENLYAVLGGGRTLFYGGYYPAVGEKCPLKVRTGSGEIWGGIYDGSLDELLSDGKVLTAVSYERYTIDDRTFFAKRESLSVSDGYLTCGVFTFNPFADEYKDLDYFKARERVVITPAGGSPATWTLGVTYVVPCKTWAQLKANIDVGNKVKLDVNFEPPADHKTPAGFVYRGRVVDEQDKGVTSSVDVTLRLYREEIGGDPVWTSQAVSVTPKSEGVFQIWVDDTLRADQYQPSLTNAFRQGIANFLTVAFNDGAECSPRRALVTTPLVNRACVANELDDTVTVGLLNTGANGAVTAAALNAGNVVCDTLELSVSNLLYNVSEMRLGGCTLYRDSRNRILSTADGAWQSGHVATGDVLLTNAPKSGLLTIQSTDGCTVPSVVVPVPRGGSFTWRSTPFVGRWRFTPFGSN